MLEAKSLHKLEELEPLLRRAAQAQGATVLTCAHLGQALREHGVNISQNALIFGICHSELYAALLAADIRFSAFLPCRIAAYHSAGGLLLESIPPREFCRILNRPDLEAIAGKLEDSLRRIIHDAAQETAAAHGMPTARTSGLGATEEQMSRHGSLPQRIDKRGSKIEDLAGTGEHDSQGG
jgi:uncharacterized protein (DUF302 family)